MINLRKLRGDITQKEFSGKLGINQAYLSKIERGKSIPKDNLVRKFCERLGIDSLQFGLKSDNGIIIGICPNCKIEFKIEDETLFCCNCGTKLKIECECGKKIHKGSKFCSYCGKEI